MTGRVRVAGSSFFLVNPCGFVLDDSTICARSGSPVTVAIRPLILKVSG